MGTRTSLVFIFTHFYVKLKPAHLGLKLSYLLQNFSHSQVLGLLSVFLSKTPFNYDRHTITVPYYYDSLHQPLNLITVLFCYLLLGLATFASDIIARYPSLLFRVIQGCLSRAANPSYTEIIYTAIHKLCGITLGKC